MSVAQTMDSTPSAVRRREASAWKYRWSRQITAYLFLLPAIVLFAIFAWYPILRAVEMSFNEVTLNGESTWVGLANY